MDAIHRGARAILASVGAVSGGVSRRLFHPIGVPLAADVFGLKNSGFFLIGERNIRALCT